MRRSFVLLPALCALFLYACADSSNSGDDDLFGGAAGTESSGTSGASGTKGGTGGKAGTGGKGGSSTAGQGGAGAGGSTGGTSAGTGQPSAENTDELCSDGKDNDDNGFADCEDINCVNSEGVTVCKQGTGGDPFGGTGGGSGENTPALCTDGKDNDNNKYVDCNDKGCCGIVDCSDEPTSYCGKQGSGGSGSGTKENTAALCKDGKDNDGDGFKDCDDYDCCDLVSCGSTTACGKQGSGGSGGSSSTGKENTAALCSDGKDNDGDSYKDCDDYDCCNLVSCGSTTACGKQGSGGSGGSGSGTKENTAALCKDGKDNDGDGYKDCDDFDCCSLIDCKADFPQSACATKGSSGSGGSSSGSKEATLTLCTDGTDNDGDKFVDCDDYDCCDIANCKVTKPTSKCATK